MLKLLSVGAVVVFAVSGAGAFVPVSKPAGVGGSATQPDAVAAALKEGKAVALIEVTGIKEQDGRPADGNLVERVSFKTVKSSGKVPEEIVIVKAFGGMRMGPPPVPKGVLFPNPLKVGQRYWVVFNGEDWEKYQQGVVAWWAEKDVPKEVEGAVSADRFGKGATAPGK
ncbi:MAG TPA: hypothetical protein VHM90_17675 [Phycisphaerae bacterium]|jgi:hypothetical protein|nr:hypothetical protein [Phycisphaerae bacterium]